MGTTVSAPWSVAMWQLLADGKAHPREALLQAGAAHVPPGRALRERERQRLRMVRGASRREHKRRTSQEKIAIGARAIVVDSLEASVRSGRINQFEKNGTVYLQLPETMTVTMKGDTISYAEAQPDLQIIVLDREGNLRLDRPTSFVELTEQDWNALFAELAAEPLVAIIDNSAPRSKRVKSS